MNAAHLTTRLMIGQGVLFAAETMIIHHIGSSVPVMELALIRSVSGIILAITVARNIGFAVVHTCQLPLQLLRGVASLIYSWVMIYSFGHLTFADATAISYTQAAYIAVFAVLLLGETVSRSQWYAAALGILGALLIAKPAFANWNSGYLIAVFGTSLNGLSFVLNRYLMRGDSEATTMFYANLVPVLGNVPILWMSGLPSSDSLLWLPSLFLLGPMGVYLGIVAVKHANASILGPYTLLRLVIALIGGMMIFREVPDISSCSGAALILASCMSSSWIGRKRDAAPS